MTKTLSLTISVAIAVIGFATAAAPTQAATRLMSSSFEGFEFRCEKHGGIFAADGTLVSCQTPSVPVACEYFTATQANCVWPGIARQIDVVRVIGTLPAGAEVYASASNGGGNSNNGGNGNGGNGGGFDGPKDIQDAPDNDPKPNFDGPKDIQDAPDNDPKPNFDGPNNFQMAP
jgi:hypothetical protein